MLAGKRLSTRCWRQPPKPNGKPGRRFGLLSRSSACKERVVVGGYDAEFRYDPQLEAQAGLTPLPGRRWWDLHQRGGYRGSRLRVSARAQRARYAGVLFAADLQP